MLKGKRPLAVAMLGLGTVEGVPLYHYHPGGSALRVRLASYASHLFSCTDEFDICIFSREGLLEPVSLEWDVVLQAARQARADIVVFEGYRVEDIIPRILIEELKRNNIAVAFRTFADKVDERLISADVVIVDYPLAFMVSPELRSAIVEGVERIAREARWAEINVYLEKPRALHLTPIVDALDGAPKPLHVHLLRHEGGGPVTRLYRLLRRRLPYVYIHNDLYPHRDTECPKCGSIVAMRSPQALQRLQLGKGQRCWKCGARLHFYGRIREKTPDNILLVTGGTRWVHPLLLKRTGSLAGLT